MRAYILIIGLLCAFLFGALGSQTGYSYLTIVPFIVSLSLVAYAGLTSHQRGGPISFDRLNQF